MKIGLVRNIRKEDLSPAGKDLPEWLDGMLPTLNDFMERVVKALTQSLTFGDNLLCKEIKDTKFTSGVEQVFSLPSGRRAAGIQVLEVLNQQVTGFGFSRKSTSSGASQIGITITWVTLPGVALTPSANCRVLVHLE